MRRLAIRSFILALLALAASQLHTGAAQACIKFDRAAEMALIDKAIAAPGTSDTNKAALKSARTKLVALAGKPDSRNRAEYGEIVWDALALIGEKRVIWSGQPELDVGVFKKTKSAKKGPTRTAEVPADAAVPACG